MENISVNILVKLMISKIAQRVRSKENRNVTHCMNYLATSRESLSSATRGNQQEEKKKQALNKTKFVRTIYSLLRHGWILFAISASRQCFSRRALFRRINSIVYA